MEIIFFLSIFLSFVLPLFVGIYFYKQDPHREPFVYLLASFFLGIIAAFLSYQAEFFLEKINFFKENYIYYSLASAFLEEFFKFYTVYSLIFPQTVFDEPMDAIVYMSFSAFGFASIENVAFITKEQGKNTLQIDPELKENNFYLLFLVFFRFLSANFLHFLASSLIALGYAYFMKTRNIFSFVVSFLAAGILHFLYNFSLIFLYSYQKLDIINLKSLLLFIFSGVWFLFFVVLLRINYLKKENE